MFRRLTALFAGLVLSTQLLSADIPLNANHPDKYTVQKGDTLWDISAMFLQNPWQWPNIWEANPQIANPHLIYPGDLLELAFIDGKPVLRLNRGGTVKLSPQIRATPLNKAIPTIPIAAIAPFLSKSYVLEEDYADSAPYIVALADEHLIGGADQRFYARKLLLDNNSSKFDIVRPGDTYRDANTDEIIGYEAEFIGSATLIKEGDPATLRLGRNKIEMLAGDRLIPVNETESYTNITPQAAGADISGSIIDVIGGVSQIGQYQMVVIDRGIKDGLNIGDVLIVDNLGETIRDPYHGKTFATVKLPDETAGTILIFRLFERVSFGIVMSATRAMHVKDRIHSPE